MRGNPNKEPMGRQASGEPNPPKVETSRTSVMLIAVVLAAALFIATNFIVGGPEKIASSETNDIAASNVAAQSSEQALETDAQALATVESSKPEAATVEMPNFIGKTLDDVVPETTGLNLRCTYENTDGTEAKVAADSNWNNWRVERQTPTAGTAIIPGTTDVVLTVSNIAAEKATTTQTQTQTSATEMSNTLNQLADNQIVYVSSTSKQYHTENCRMLQAEKIAVMLNDAQAAGYTACEVCNPQAQ